MKSKSALLLLAFLLTTNIYRAARQSIVSDEAFTYTRHVAVPRFWAFEHYTANNHVLYTVLLKLSTGAFGLSALSLRLPSLVGGLLYFAALFRLSQFLFGRSVWFLFSIVLNSLNPLILDYLSVARGYGLGLAFFTWGLYFSLRYVTAGGGDRATAIKAGAAWGLAAASQLTYILPAAALGAVSILLVRNWRTAAQMIATAASVSCALLAWPMRSARPGDFYVGLSSLQQSLDSLARASLLYKETALGKGIVEILQFLFPLLGAFALVAFLAGRRSGKPQPALLLILGGALLCPLLLLVARMFVAQPFPPERAGLYVYLLTWLACLLALQSSNSLRIVPAVGGLVLALYALQYALEYNVTHYFVYREDAGDKDIIDTIRARQAGDHQLGVQVGASWPIADSLELYRSMYHLDWMEPITRDNPDCYFDYYVLLPQDHRIAARYEAEVLLRHPVSPAILTKLSDRGFHPPRIGEPAPCGISAGKMSAFAKMTEPAGKSQVARGMVPGDNVWAFNRVLLFFRVQQTENVKFAMRFGVHSDVFSHTGPITVSIRINGKPFAHETYNRPEEYVFEKPVPAGFLAADSLTVIDVGVDKYYLTPDGTKLTVLLLEAGFVPAF